MESRHWTGDDTREFSSPPEPERINDDDLIAEFVALAVRVSQHFINTDSPIGIAARAVLAKAEQR